MDSNESDLEAKFISYVVIEFEPECLEEVKTWLKETLEAPRSQNGAEFITKFNKNLNEQDVFLSISATTKRLLEGAEEIGLKKLYNTGLVKDFLIEDMRNFTNSTNPNHFLNQSDCLKIIDTQLNSLFISSAVEEFGEDIKLNKYDGIINQLINLKQIKAVYPLHDKGKLKKLENQWYRSRTKLMQSIPIDKIRNYFGESTAFYFGFFEYYTLWIIPLTIFSNLTKTRLSRIRASYSIFLTGVLTWLTPISSFIRFVICAICNLIWSTIFIEKWKRKSSELSYSWGIFDLDLTDKPRPQYYGIESTNPITGKPEKYYPKENRILKKYLVSYPVIGVSIFIAFAIMMVYYHYQHIIDIAFPDASYMHWIIRLSPSVLYSFIVIPLNLIYKFTAIKLTDWVNFRSLSNLLISMVIVNAFFNKIIEVIGPYFKTRIKSKILLKKGNLSKEQLDLNIQANALQEYEGTYSDYVTLFEQFGYITMFSAVFPWVSIAALINNIAEQRSDAFKYCRLNKRPFPRTTTAGIGTWTLAFEIIGLISVMTNFALIALHPEVRSYFHEYSDMEYFLIFVLCEHILICIKITIAFAIPDETMTVTIKKQKYKYELLEALRHERLARSTKLK